MTRRRVRDLQRMAHMEASRVGARLATLESTNGGHLRADFVTRAGESKSVFLFQHAIRFPQRSKWHRIGPQGVETMSKETAKPLGLLYEQAAHRGGAAASMLGRQRLPNGLWACCGIIRE